MHLYLLGLGNNVLSPYVFPFYVQVLLSMYVWIYLQFLYT